MGKRIKNPNWIFKRLIYRGIFVTAADDAVYRVSIGFVRAYDAAWSGEPAGSATESDWELARVPLADVRGRRLQRNSMFRLGAQSHRPPRVL